MLDPSLPVADLVRDHSECAEVLSRHRIDFCCRGDQSLEAAATSKGVDLGSLVDELTGAIDARRGDRPPDLRKLSTPQLVAHIVSTHHEYLRKALPFIRATAAKVSRVHGAHNPKLVELASAVDELAAVLLPHLDEEEQTLFPLLIAPSVDGTKIEALLGEMVDEHHGVARLMERARAASDDFTLPDWACSSYRTLFSELVQLESDVFVHVHLENHVLLPRFVKPEPAAPATN